MPALLFSLVALGFAGSASAQATPVAPGNLQATFQRNGNATQLRWTPRAAYDVSADLRVLGSYDYTATDALSSWDAVGLQLSSWGRSGNIVRQSVLRAFAVYLHYPGGDGLTNYSFSARVRATTNLLVGARLVGIMFRYVDQNNYYYLALNTTEARVVRRQNGTETVLARFAMARVTNQWYTLRVELAGANIQGFINGTRRFNLNDSAHSMGSFGLYTNNQQSDFTGPTGGTAGSAFPLRNALGFQIFSPASVRAQWTNWGPGNWSNTTYELRQSVNTPVDTGYAHDRHAERKDYTFTQQMRISPANDDDVIGMVFRYTRNQASPHRFTGYLFEWSRGGAGDNPSRRLVRVTNGGYGSHTGSPPWQRINHTILHSDNTRWVANRWYRVTAQVKGNVIKIWINGTLWVTHTDNTRGRIEKGSFGFINYSNPNFNVRHLAVRYDDNEFDGATKVTRTAAVNSSWTQLSTDTVGATLSTPINDFITKANIPRAHVSVKEYKITMVDSSTFEGKLSTSAAGAHTGTNASARPYGRQKPNTLRYHVYRNNVRLTNTPITTQSYKDQYGNCTPRPGTKYDYQVTQLNPANRESPRSSTASITTANDKPTIAGVPNQTATHGVRLTLNVATYVNDINVPNNSLTISEDSSYATVSGQVITFLYPANDPITEEKVKITVTDCHGESASMTITVTLRNRPPRFTSTPPTSATQNKKYSYTPAVTDPDRGDTLTFKVNKKPTAATFNVSDGTITWTPGPSDVNKSFDFEIEVCDKAGTCVKQSWTVKVKNVNDPPAFTSKPPTTGTEDQLYTYKPVVTDPDPNDTLTFKFTKQPKGATIDPNTGEIKWTPGDDHGGRDVDIEIEVCDKSGACVKQAWKVKVANVNDPPTFVSKPPTTAKERQAYTYIPKVNDPDPGDNANLTYSFKKSPKGATIDPKTGKISWTPDADDVKAGSRDFTVEVCDKSGACTQQTWTVKVENVNDPPKITGTPPTSAEVGKELTYSPTVTDPDPGSTHTWRLTKAPPGATIDPKTGALKWTPAAADGGKEIEFEIEVCDNGTPKACDKQSFKVKVTNPCNLDIDCPTGQICVTGACIPAGCDAKNPKCPAGEVCLNGTCTKDPCDNNNCQSGEICRPSDGKCIKPCAGVTCQAGEQCVDGKCEPSDCKPACKVGEFCQTVGAGGPKCIKDPCRAGACRYGRLCEGGTCKPDPCAGLTCPTKTRCVAGQCQPPKSCDLDVDCPTDQVCIGQQCTPAGCYTKNCASKQQCLKAKCEADPCDGNSCKATEFCRITDGKCAAPCGGVTCNAGETCFDGKCSNDPCASVTCPAGDICTSGNCQRNLCNASNLCKHGRICEASQCKDDPCFGVKCPDSKHVCVKGQCIASGCQFDKECTGTDICVNRKCVQATCPDVPCNAGERCENGKCLKDPCDGKKCAAGEFCKASAGGNAALCISSCAGIFCPAGQLCLDGQCVADPCDGVKCQAGEVCRNGKCIKDECAKDSCKQGRICRADTCVDDPCAGIKCPTGQQCQTQNANNGDGQCVGDKACKHDSDCAGDGICVDKVCAPPGCYRAPCSGAQLCIKGKCIDDPCANSQCKDDEVCRPIDGKCVPTCPTCPAGETCKAGKCEADPCDGVKCKDTERCEAGKCITDICSAVNTQLCKYKRSCSDTSCDDDPCTGVKCADGTCRNGTCTRPPGPTEPTEGTTEPPQDGGADGGNVDGSGTTDGNEATGDTTGNDVTQSEGNKDNTNKDIAGGDTGNDADPGLIPGGGCGCSTSDPAPPATFLLLFALAFFFRRRKA